jgi:ankyrin repeat domain-containing protein 17
MLIEAAKGGHTSVVQLLLDYPHSIMMATPHPHNATVAGVSGAQTQTAAGAVSTTGGLHEVPEAVRVVSQEDLQVNTSQSMGAAKSSGSQAGGPLFQQNITFEVDIKCYI